MDPESIVAKYGMLPHPEGGFYVETFRSDVVVDIEISNDVVVKRPASTAILFMVTPGNVSRLHRIKSDEIWHFYIGGSISVVEIGEDGGKTTVVGSNIIDGEMLQYCVKANTWFGCYLNPGADYALVGCTVAPGFTFEDFELASRSKLLEQYPSDKELIEKLTIGLP